jgi:NAD(P)-dependent dehydrogenase (short-subunit alcohol dehydrogenase family)
MSADSSHFARYPSLEGRAVLITGGATGIGRSLVEHFALQAARVALFDVQDEPAQALVESLTAAGCPEPLYSHCDLTDLDELKTCFERAITALGTVDVLVNNAANDRRHATEAVTPEMWESLMAINLRQQFFAIQAVLPAMKAAGRGSIINMSSISWIIPTTGLPVYIAAKAGVVGLTRTLAHELGPAGIRVNAVLPGAIATEKQKLQVYTPEGVENILRNQALKRQLEPDEVARLVLFLAADDSSAITSQSYVADAGWV